MQETIENSKTLSARPIFVMGMPRGGTTLVGSLIAQHPQISGVLARRYGGLKETDMFGPIDKYFGDISNPIDLVRFVETFSATDYFVRTGAQKSLFYKTKPRNIHSFFTILMDDFANRSNSSHWVEKSPTHLLCFNKIISMYPDAYFVVVRRNTIDCVRSYLALKGSDVRIGRFTRLLKASLRYAIYENRLNKLVSIADKPNYEIIEFESLLDDMPKVCIDLCENLKIPYSEYMCAPQFEKNTSFFDNTIKNARKSTHSKLEHVAITLVLRLFKLVPNYFAERAAQKLLLWGKRPMAHHWGMLFEEHKFNEAEVSPGGWGGLPENRPSVKKMDS